MLILFIFSYRTKINELDEKVANLEARLREITPDIRSRINGYPSISNLETNHHFSPTASLMSPLRTKRSDSISTDHNLNYEGKLKVYYIISKLIYLNLKRLWVL